MMHKTGGSKIFMINWSLSEDKFCSVGPDHVFFWDLYDPTRGKKGTFGKVSQMTNILCVAGSESGHFYTGAVNGSIIKWGYGSILN